MTLLEHIFAAILLPVLAVTGFLLGGHTVSLTVPITPVAIEASTSPATISQATVIVSQNKTQPTKTTEMVVVPQSNSTAATAKTNAQTPPAQSSPQTYTTPSGAVIDSSGNVVQPAQVQAPTVSINQLENALAALYAQNNLSTVLSSIPQLLSILSNAQAHYNDVAQERALCVSEYNSQVTYFQQLQAVEMMNGANSTGGSSVTKGSASYNAIMAQNQLQMDDLQNTENTCLAEYPASLETTAEISNLTTQTNQLQQKVATNPTDPSEISSILQNFNSIYGQVEAINSSMQSPVSLPSQTPSSGFFNCSSGGGAYTCNGAGVSMSCSLGSAGSLNCVSTDGQDYSCSGGGGNLSCSY
jgi:hypothetical protein